MPNPASHRPPTAPLSVVPATAAVEPAGPDGRLVPRGSEPELLFNPRTTETLRVLTSTPEVFIIELSLSPRAAIAGLHVHPHQTQTISVVRGTLACHVDGQEVVLGPGASCAVPPGARHDQRNPGDEPAVAREEYRPAARMHDFFRVLFALARDGYTSRHGVPRPLVAAALFAEFSDSIAVASRVERLALAVLTPLARLLRRDRLIRRYLVAGGDR